VVIVSLVLKRSDSASGGALWPEFLKWNWSWYGFVCDFLSNYFSFFFFWVLECGSYYMFFFLFFGFSMGAFLISSFRVDFPSLLSAENEARSSCVGK
jgi:hypothetical protein